MSLAEALLELEQLTARLRRDCPWDREQSARTIVPHTVEEAYEVADAALAGEPEKLLDELGDLLFQVYFLALLLSEEGHGGLEEVARGVHAKLVRRHPHVFGDVDATTAEHVEANWEVLKAAEKGRTSAVEGVPMAQPALALAAKLMSRAAKAGVDVPVAVPSVDESADLGELLLGVVRLARQRGLDPEAELRAAARRYADRVRTAERRSAT